MFEVIAADYYRISAAEALLTPTAAAAWGTEDGRTAAAIAAVMCDILSCEKFSRICGIIFPAGIKMF